MIVVNCALKQNDIIEIVERIEIENEKVFKFIKKQGIKLFFESTYKDNSKACSVIKSIIKSSPFGSALFFNVLSE